MAEAHDTPNQRTSNTAGMNARSDKDRPLPEARADGDRVVSRSNPEQADLDLDRGLSGATLTAGTSSSSASASWGAGNTVRTTGGLHDIGGAVGSADHTRRINVSSGEDTSLSHLPSSDSSMPGSEAFQRQGRSIPGSGAFGQVGPASSAAVGEASDLDHVVDVLNDLVECCRDGEYGFNLCAEHMKDRELKQRLGRHADECRSSARELMDSIRQLGGEADDGGSAMGSVHRGWVSLKGALSGYSDKAMLKEAERGQATAVARYRKALQEKLPPEVRSLVQQQAECVQRNHDEMKAWRDRLQGRS